MTLLSPTIYESKILLEWQKYPSAPLDKSQQVIGLTLTNVGNLGDSLFKAYLSFDATFLAGSECRDLFGRTTNHVRAMKAETRCQRSEAMEEMQY